MESNTVRIPNATFTCMVSAKNLRDMGTEAWKACQAYFGDQPFEITDLSADSLQTVALETLFYTARVYAKAV